MCLACRSGAIVSCRCEFRWQLSQASASLGDFGWAKMAAAASGPERLVCRYTPRLYQYKKGEGCPQAASHTFTVHWHQFNVGVYMQPLLR